MGWFKTKNKNKFEKVDYFWWAKLSEIYGVIFICGAFCASIAFVQAATDRVGLENKYFKNDQFNHLDPINNHVSQSSKSQCFPAGKMPISQVLLEGQQLWGDVTQNYKVNKTMRPKDSLYPCWLNPALVQIGQNFAKNNFIQVGAGHFLSLVMLLANPQMRQILYATGKSETPRKAFDRYAATGMQLQLWYRESIFSPNWVQSVTTVRAIHDSVAKNLKRWTANGKLDFSRPLVSQENNPTGISPNRKMWAAFYQDIESGRRKIEFEFEKRNRAANFSFTYAHVHEHRPGHLFNQYLMVVTQWCFVALPVILPTRVGIPRGMWREEELMGFAHLWAVISYALGMKEEFILCRDPGDLLGCKRDLRDMFHTHILPSLYTIDFEGQLMMEALLKSTNYAAPGVPIDYFLIKILEDIVEIPAKNLYRQSKWQTRLGRYFSRHWALPLYTSPVVRNIANATTFTAMHMSSRIAFGDPGYNLTKVAQEFYVF